MFDAVVKLFIAAGSVNADPIGPNACPTSINPFQWDPKPWWGVTWTNGDSTAYTYISEDNGATVLVQISPGRASYEDSLWSTALLESGVVKIKHVKDGVDDSCGWQTVAIA